MGMITCSVDMTECYLQMDHLSGGSHARVFRAIVHNSEGERLCKSDRLSYSQLRKLLLEKITQLSMDPQLFGIHGLRAGSARAAANVGVLDTLFQRHGHWQSGSAKDSLVMSRTHWKGIYQSLRVC